MIVRMDMGLLEREHIPRIDRTEYWSDIMGILLLPFRDCVNYEMGDEESRSTLTPKKAKPHSYPKEGRSGVGRPACHRWDTPAPRFPHDPAATRMK